MASEKKKFLISISTLRWFDAQGGHFEDEGIFPHEEKTVQKVPNHRHHVNLNIYRTDISFRYYPKPSWMLEVNLPYETKIQEASVEKIDPVTDEQWEAIKLNGHIHHRNETYTGLADADMFVGQYWQGIFKENDFLMARLGLTIPFGQTEENPWILGEQGLEHLHIQFGTGTFNPVSDIYYSIPIYKGLATHSSIRVKFPFYENDKTYRGSRELTYTAGLNYRLNKSVTFQVGYLGFYQFYAYWDGEIDKNTGLVFGMASISSSITTPFNVPISLALMLPLHQQTLYNDAEVLAGTSYEESDAFKFGPLLSLTVMYFF